MLVPTQVKMARAALGLGVRDLAKLAGVSPNTVTRFEGGGGVHTSNLQKIQAALETAGVAFIPENGGGPGVRLKTPGQ